MNHFHVVSYTTENRLADNVVKPTRKSANDLAASWRAKYGAGRSVGVLPCDNQRHATR